MFCRLSIILSVRNISVILLDMYTLTAWSETMSQPMRIAKIYSSVSIICILCVFFLFLHSSLIWPCFTSNLYPDPVYFVQRNIWEWDHFIQNRTSTCSWLAILSILSGRVTIICDQAYSICTKAVEVRTYIYSARYMHRSLNLHNHHSQ